MKLKTAILVAFLCSALMPASFALAANQIQDRERTQLQEQEQIYGSQMMSEQERNEYRARMQAAKTNEEREQIRLEHHMRMQEKAQARGRHLPDTPMPRKGSMNGGMGGGMGGGKGRSK